MALGDIDARIVTAVCMWIIGCLVTSFVVKVWWTPPVRRPFLFGPYLTPDGITAALKGWPMLFWLGALALAGGTSRFVHWLRWRHMASNEAAALFGLLEAVLALWAAGSLVLFTIRTWRNWKKWKAR